MTTSDSELQIPTVSELSYQEFDQRFLRLSRPVIIKGATKDWPSWTPEYLSKVLGERRFQMRISMGDSYIQQSNEGADAQFLPKVEMPFTDAQQRICMPDSSGCRYYFQQQLWDLPELVKELTIPFGLEQKKITSANLWFGSAGNVTPLHFDPLNNFFVQVRGRKSFTIVDPSQSSGVYPMPVSSAVNTMSRVDIENPDYQQFPEFKSVKSINFTVVPGDVLFIPPFWWHHVRSLEVSISVNFWW